MKAVDTNLLELLKVSTQFVVPIYQRVYSWGEAECRQLWDDIVRAGTRADLANHFTGSVVYIERDEGTNTAAEPSLIIDGQQRVTTVMLLLAALATRLDELPEGEREPVEGFAPEKIRGLYLSNLDETGEKFYKLLLSKGDQEALKAIIRQAPIPEAESRVPTNFRLLQDWLTEPDVDLVAVCRGLSKLVVVDVKLKRGIDDPQLVFESMNSTGKRLSEADLIRNFVLMDLPPPEQERLYEDYWFPMEQAFAGSKEKLFDEFVRHYLTLKTGQIPRIGDIYDAFKAYAFDIQRDDGTREELVTDLNRHAAWFAAMALGQEVDRRLAQRFDELETLRASVVYPFLLRLYADFDAKVLSQDDFVEILDGVLSYVVRRLFCRIPTNTLNTTFASLGAAVDPDHYVESVLARLLTLPTHRRFPTDEEFAEALRTGDVYNLRRASYLFRKLENHGRKEEVSIAEYTIEHILPQNPDLSDEWRTALGPDWEGVQERLLHTLGNLTLTGYNPEYSDHPFPKKRDMEGGFRESPLRLNQGLRELETWDAEQIEARARRLAAKAVEIWERPSLDEKTLAGYRGRFNDKGGFDWSATHAILAAIPEGRWTTYHQLAEAVGTGPQALGSHLSTCRRCPNPHRVLTWDGKVADSFRWHDADDDRLPTEMLRDEGVHVEDGTANREQQLVAEELLALVEDD